MTLIGDERYFYLSLLKRSKHSSNPTKKKSTNAKENTGHLPSMVGIHSFVPGMGEPEIEGDSRSSSILDCRSALGCETASLQ